MLLAIEILIHSEIQIIALRAKYVEETQLHSARRDPEACLTENWQVAELDYRESQESIW